MEKLSSEQASNYFNSLIGKEINNTYRIEEKLGAGGMGAVFRATHLQKRSRVAVKVISPHLAANPVFIKRFKREARVGWAISHPHIIKVYEFGETEDGLLFMVMEFIEGETLKDYIKRSAPLSIARCLELLEPLCEALDTAHRRNLLHRDLKPANVLISREDDKETIKLADFGIVKLLQPDDEISQGSNLTEMGEIFGTPHYMSPEQFMGHIVGPTTDIYSLGVITFEMLTSKVPIENNNFREFIKLKTRHELPIPSAKFPFLPSALDEVLLKVLACDPEQRYQTVSEFLTAFKGAANRILESEVPDKERNSYLSSFSSDTIKLSPPSATLSSPTLVPTPTGLSSQVTNSVQPPATSASPVKSVWIIIGIVVLFIAIILILFLRG